MGDLNFNCYNKTYNKYEAHDKISHIENSSLGLSLCIQLYYSLGHFLDEFQRSRFTSGVLYPKVGVWYNVPPFVFL